MVFFGKSRDLGHTQIKFAATEQKKEERSEKISSDSAVV